MRAASSTDAYVPNPPVPEAMGLLDGGATNPLRTAMMDELDHARVVNVTLASGETRLWMNRTGTLLSDAEVDPIVPMGCLAMLPGRARYAEYGIRTGGGWTLP